MIGFYCIAFIECVLAGKTLLDYANLFSLNDYKKNHKIIYKYFKDIYDKPWFQTKKIHEKRNYPFNEIKHNDLISEKRKKKCKALNFFEHFLVFASSVSGCVLISAFGSLVGVPVGTASSAVGLKICAVTAGIKKYNLIIQKKRKNMIKQYCQEKLRQIEFLISKALMNSCVSHDVFISVNNVLRRYNEIKKKIKNLQNTVEYII